MSITYVHDEAGKSDALRRGIVEEEIQIGLPLLPWADRRRIYLQLAAAWAARAVIAFLCAQLPLAFEYQWTHPDQTQMQVLQAAAEWAIPWRWMP